jgi:hypothetical protein
VRATHDRMRYTRKDEPTHMAIEPWATSLAKLERRTLEKEDSKRSGCCSQTEVE